MKAVNQSIGRCIRHAKDYGAIILVDKRFRRPQIQSRLPKWIQTRIKQTTKFGEVFSSVAGFFKSKKK
jgi:Rad3-related DNA helicase